MKTLLKRITFLMIVSLTLYNCSSDDDASTGETPLLENTRLTAYSVNTIEFAVNYNTEDYISGYESSDTSQPRSVVYNTDNQIIQFGRISYMYNAQGRISQITEADDTTFRNKTSSIVYNNEGLIATQNFRFTYVSSGDTVFVNRVYDYNSSGQLISITEDSSLYKTRDLMTYDSRGNIVQIKRQSSPDGITYTDQQTTTFTYDNKKNPGKKMLENMGIDSNFSLLHIRYNLTINFSNYAFFRLSYYSNNNVISSQSTYSSGQTNRTYDYVYNDNDYPTAAEEDVALSDGTSYTSYKTWTYESY